MGWNQTASPLERMCSLTNEQAFQQGERQSTLHRQLRKKTKTKQTNKQTNKKANQPHVFRIVQGAKRGWEQCVILYNINGCRGWRKYAIVWKGTSCELVKSLNRSIGKEEQYVQCFCYCTQTYSDVMSARNLRWSKERWNVSHSPLNFTGARSWPETQSLTNITSQKIKDNTYSFWCAPPRTNDGLALQ